jgi:hypothetical protein
MVTLAVVSGGGATSFETLSPTSPFKLFVLLHHSNTVPSVSEIYKIQLFNINSSDLLNQSNLVLTPGSDDKVILQRPGTPRVLQSPDHT